MQPKPRYGVICTIVIAGFLLLVGGLSAQAPGPGGQGGMSGFTAPGGDEVFPRLFSTPGGEILRLWQRTADLRAGGGAVLLAASGEQDTWRVLLEISPSEKGVSGQDPELAVGPSGELALVYQWWRHDPRAKHVRVAHSSDLGKSWAQPAIPVDSSGKAFEPMTAWGRGRALVVAWADERRGNRLFDIYVRRSPDGGVTWDPEQAVSQFPEKGPSELHARPRLVSDGQNRFSVVWVGLRAGRSALYLSRSTDAGRTWTSPVALSGESVSVYGHTLHQAGDRLLLVWQDTRTGLDRLYAASSSDGGVTWAPPVRVDHLPEKSPAVAVFPVVLLRPDGEAFAVWQDTRNGREDIYAATSGDGGRTWGNEDQRLDADEQGTAISRHPRVVPGPSGEVAVAWEDDRTGYEGIYLRVRAADRTKWGPETRVTLVTPKKADRLPQLFWGRSGQIYLAWEVWDYTLGPTGITKRIAIRSLRPPLP